MVKDHSDSEKGNLLLPHRLLFPINSKGSFIYRQDSTYHSLCYTSCGALAGTRNSSMGSPHEGSIRRPITPSANALTTELYLAPELISDVWNLTTADFRWLESPQHRWFQTSGISSPPLISDDWNLLTTADLRCLESPHHRWLQMTGISSPPLISDVWNLLTTADFRWLESPHHCWFQTSGISSPPLISDVWNLLTTADFRRLESPHHRWSQMSGISSTPLISDVWNLLITADFRCLESPHHCWFHWAWCWASPQDLSADVRWRIILLACYKTSERFIDWLLQAYTDFHCCMCVY